MAGKVLALAFFLACASAVAGAAEIGVGTKNFTPPPGTPSYLIGEDGALTAWHFAPPTRRESTARPAPPLRFTAAPPRHYTRRITYRAKRAAPRRYVRHVRHLAPRRRIARLVGHRVVRHVVRHNVRRVVHRTKVARPKLARRRIAG